MSDESFWISRNGKESRPLNPSIDDGDVLVRVEGDEERCVTSGLFEEGPSGALRLARRPAARSRLDPRPRSLSPQGFSRRLLATAARVPLSGKVVS